MPEAHNVDSLIVSSMNPDVPPIDPSPAAPAQEVSVEQEHIEEVPQAAEQSSSDPYGASEPEPTEEKVETKSHIDEYGNSLEKPKMYSEDDLQRILRDRLSRVKNPDTQQQQQIRQDAQNFQSDPNSEDSWEVQLNKFIDNRLESRHKEQNERAWREQETQRQAEFEAKFISGMSKYKDFNDVVAGKPITDTMLMATRNLENPAAFLYAASKLHASELKRISEMSDHLAQASEMGRLDERMRKEHRKMSQSGRPLDPPKESLPMAKNPQPSIDNRIAEHAKQKRR